MQPFFFGNAIDLLRERERIHAVNQFEQRQCMPDFVFLEVPDEMPAQVGRQFRDLH